MLHLYVLKDAAASRAPGEQSSRAGGGAYIPAHIGGCGGRVSHALLSFVLKGEERESQINGVPLEESRGSPDEQIMGKGGRYRKADEIRLTASPPPWKNENRQPSAYFAQPLKSTGWGKGGRQLVLTARRRCQDRRGPVSPGNTKEK